MIREPPELLALFFFLLSMVWNELGKGKDNITSDLMVKLNARSHKFVKIGLALSGILIIYFTRITIAAEYYLIPLNTVNP